MRCSTIAVCSLAAASLCCQAAPPKQTKAERGSLAAGTVAQVGSQPISSRYLAQVMREHRLGPARALDQLVGDTLLAEGARARFAPTGLLAAVERSAEARALLEELHAAAVRLGPVTDAEIDALLRQDGRWMDLDRPVSVKTAHAVVLTKDNDDDRGARAAAERVAEETRGAGDAEAFMKAAQAVDVGAFDKRVETLPHMTADGRAVYLNPLDPRRRKPAHFDAAFARAANAIPTEGQQSSVFKSSFGYHVVFLIERVDGVHFARADLRRKLAKDVFDERAATEVSALVGRLEKGARIEIARNVAQLTEQVSAPP